MVTSFRYLGRVISAADDDLPAVVINLSRARAVWKRIMQILSREGAAPRVPRFFFKPWCRQCCSSYRRPRCTPPAWERPWGGG